MQQVAAVADVARNKTERVTIAEASRRLGINNRSTLGRYVEKYPELLDGSGRVDFGELVQHREDNPQVKGNAGDERPRRENAPVEGSRRGNKHRLEEIKSWRAELEWAKETGQLVDPGAFTDALAEAAVSLRDKFMAPDPALCERIAGETDPRAVMALLREANRAALDDFAASMKRLAAVGQEQTNADV